MLPELEEIKRRRRALDLTQAELAKQTHLSRSLIAKIEIGRATPSYTKTKKIFDTLEAEERKTRPTLQGVSLGQICSRSVEYAEDDETIYDVWKRMETTTYSQLPVRRRTDCQTVGSITERAINRAIMEADPAKKRENHVSSIIEEPFPLLPAETSVADIIGLLQHSQAVLVQEKGIIIGIATNTDIGKVFDLLKP